LSIIVIDGLLNDHLIEYFVLISTFNLFNLFRLKQWLLLRKPNLRLFLWFEILHKVLAYLLIINVILFCIWIISIQNHLTIRIQYHFSAAVSSHNRLPIWLVSCNRLRLNWLLEWLLLLLLLSLEYNLSQVILVESLLPTFARPRSRLLLTLVRSFFGFVRYEFGYSW
jgi:hypothetical protein